MATVQFRPIDSLTFTADALYATNETVERRMDQTNWFNRPFGQVTFDDTAGQQTVWRTQKLEPQAAAQ